MALYRRAGARYVIAQGMHHDNFDLWDSKYQPWNSVIRFTQKGHAVYTWPVAKAGVRAFVYAFAFYTGIRRKELKSLLVTDLEKLDGKWSVTVRAAISKNRQKVKLPIYQSLVPALETHLAGRVGQRLLFASIPRCDTLREDLKCSGLTYKDDEGKQADFHALRHALSTHLGANHAAPRAQMSMMRH